MTRSNLLRNVMIEAWAIHRAARCKFSLALRQAWIEIKKQAVHLNMPLNERIKNAGGSLWEKNGMSRVYFNFRKDAKVYFCLTSRKVSVYFTTTGVSAQWIASQRNIVITRVEQLIANHCI